MNKQNTQTNAAKSFNYNVIFPDFMILTVGLTTGFATLLSVFS